MKASVILSHPYPQSFNHALYDAVCRRFETMGVDLFAHDLYAEGFNPVLSCDELGSDSSSDPLAVRYAQELLESDILCFIHPNWWGQPPAMMKGYIDRVIRPPYAYDFPEGDLGGLPVGKLAGKYCIVLNTSNTAAEREDGYFGDPLENIWKQCVCGFCGIDRFSRTMFRIVADSSLEQRTQWLGDACGIVERAAAELRK